MCPTMQFSFIVMIVSWYWTGSILGSHYSKFEMEVSSTGLTSIEYLTRCHATTNLRYGQKIGIFVRYERCDTDLVTRPCIQFRRSDAYRDESICLHRNASLSDSSHQALLPVECWSAECITLGLIWSTTDRSDRRSLLSTDWFDKTIYWLVWWTLFTLGGLVTDRRSADWMMSDWSRFNQIVLYIFGFNWWALS